MFTLRRAEREGQKAQLNEQIGQLAEQSSGTVAEMDAKTTEIYWSKEELKGVEELWKKKLVEFTRLTALQRDGARLEGERGRLASSLAEIRSKTAEIKLKILQVDEGARIGHRQGARRHPRQNGGAAGEADFRGGPVEAHRSARAAATVSCIN